MTIVEKEIQDQMHALFLALVPDKSCLHLSRNKKYSGIGMYMYHASNQDLVSS